MWRPAFGVVGLAGNWATVRLRRAQPVRVRGAQPVRVRGAQSGPCCSTLVED
ncbi:MAG: hypothetical protein JO120_11290 [Solirubrobacterales bacterium]|nr:hypothetical protein [Solirubrobacterales bacterium]